MNIGMKLKEFRKTRGLTLEELATNLNALNGDETSFSKGRISKWENNKDEPRLSSMKIIADFYGVNIDSFYMDSEQKPTISSIYNQLSERNKEKLLHLSLSILNDQRKTKSKPNLPTSDQIQNGI